MIAALDRDPTLATRLGDPALRAPEEGEVVAWVAQHLAVADGPRPIDATWEHARWKPGVALTCSYRVRLEDGAERRVGYKLYADAERAKLRARPPRADAVPGGFGDVPRTVVDDGRGLLFDFSADRALPGIGRLLDARWTGRRIEAAAPFAGLRLRRRRTEFHVRRYKPERRAVVELVLALRDGEDELTTRRLAARVLPPEVAGGVERRRRAFEAAGGATLGPTLAGGELRAGVLFEHWLTDATDTAPSPREAGALLARLHALPPGGGEHASPRAAGSELPANLELVGIAATPPALEPRPVRPERWIHGDFHADQSTGAGGRLRFLDLDLLGLGEPVQDLASWLADGLADGDAGTAGAELLGAYEAAGGALPAPGDLASTAAAELIGRAAGCLRRLERGAVERARALCELAVQIRERAPW